MKMSKVIIVCGKRKKRRKRKRVKIEIEKEAKYAMNYKKK